MPKALIHRSAQKCRNINWKSISLLGCFFQTKTINDATSIDLYVRMELYGVVGQAKKTREDNRNNEVHTDDYAIYIYKLSIHNLIC